VTHCEAHHIEHWADGGETKLGNLALLCKLFRYRNNLHYADSRITPTCQGRPRRDGSLTTVQSE
jgi:hypothetical protein